MKTGPRYKICKRLGNGVFEKCQSQKYSLSEERSKKSEKRSKGNMSDFAKQMLEKQRVRMLYGITERQFRKYVDESLAHGKEAKTELLSKLESRLDNTLYRVGLTKTRRAARQMAAHGHVMVNKKRVTVPSYNLSKGDVIEVRDGSKTKAHIVEAKERITDVTAPRWIKFENASLVATVLEQPNSDNTEMPFDLAQVLEFYSR